jgi:PAS domain S-box-containing protein
LAKGGREGFYKVFQTAKVLPGILNEDASHSSPVWSLKREGDAMKRKQERTKEEGPASLRRRSDRLLSQKPENTGEKIPEDMAKLVHELQVHQIVLEMQNEALRKAQVEIEKSRSRYFELYDLAPVGYFTFNQKGMILEANLTGAKLLGVERSFLPRLPFIRFLSPESHSAFHLHLKAVFSTGVKEVCELKLIRENGDSFYVSVESISSKDSEGDFPQCRSAIMDITARKRAEEAVKAERRQFNDVLETLPVYIILLTPDYSVVYANRFFRERFGDSHGRRCFEYLFGRSEPCEVCETYTVLKTMVPHGWEWTGPDGRNYSIYDFPFADTKGSTHILEMGIDITDHKRAEAAMRESESRLMNLSSQRLTAQETERKRVAGELHDSIAASLGAMRFKIDKIVEEMKQGHAAPEALQDLSSTVTEINNEVRRIMADLRPSVLDDLGIIPAISWFCREYQKTYSHISVEKHIRISELEVPDSLKTPIFRIFQEAMNNVAKHSKATVVNLSLQKGSGIELVIWDNGQGFDPDTPKMGLGFSTMRERAQLSGGTCSIESVKGAGTTVRCAWPLA